MEQRDNLDSKVKERYDRQICIDLWQIIEDRKCKTIHTYLSMGSEINLYPVIAKALEDGMNVVVPKTLKRGRLIHLKLNSLNELQPGLYNTRHPIPEMTYDGIYDLIIVPGLAFDHNKYRLGYGGGYYDRFLASIPDVMSVGLCYPFQMMENLPLEEHDISLDEVLVPDEHL